MLDIGPPGGLGACGATLGSILAHTAGAVALAGGTVAWVFGGLN